LLVGGGGNGGRWVRDAAGIMVWLTLGVLAVEPGCWVGLGRGRTGGGAMVVWLRAESGSIRGSCSDLLALGLSCKGAGLPLRASRPVGAVSVLGGSGGTRSGWGVRNSGVYGGGLDRSSSGVLTVLEETLCLSNLTALTILSLSPTLVIPISLRVTWSSSSIISPRISLALKVPARFPHFTFVNH
jgi:hypothetical protein